MIQGAEFYVGWVLSLLIALAFGGVVLVAAFYAGAAWNAPPAKESDAKRAALASEATLRMSTNIERQLSKMGAAPRILMALEIPCDQAWQHLCASTPEGPEGPEGPLDQVRNAPAILRRGINIRVTFRTIPDPKQSPHEQADSFSQVDYRADWPSLDHVNVVTIGRIGKSLILGLAGNLKLDHSVGRPVSLSDRDRLAVMIESESPALKGASPNVLTITSEGGDLFIEGYSEAPRGSLFGPSERDTFVAYHDPSDE